MNDRNLVTATLALRLWNYGYRERCARFAYRIGDKYIISGWISYENWRTVKRYMIVDGKKVPSEIPVPTVDEAIDWLRKKYNIVICNKTDPYVCPKTGKIQFGYRIKKCYPKAGWNMRQYIGVSIWSANIYAAKRDAIRKALTWLKKDQNAKTRRKSSTRR